MAASRADELGAAHAWRGPVESGARKRALTAAGLVAAAAAIVWVGAPVCPTALFFGIPCPGCGLTRATLALVRGDVTEALGFHPLAPVLAPLFFGAMLVALRDYVRGSPRGPRRSWWAGRIGTILAAGLFVLVFGVWALRFAGFFGGPVPVQSLHSLR